MPHSVLPAGSTPVRNDARHSSIRARRTRRDARITRSASDHNVGWARVAAPRRSCLQSRFKRFGLSEFNGALISRRIISPSLTRTDYLVIKGFLRAKPSSSANNPFN